VDTLVVRYHRSHNNDMVGTGSLGGLGFEQKQDIFDFCERFASCLHLGLFLSL
jgi:hypothetical protein